MDTEWIERLCVAGAVLLATLIAVKVADRLIARHFKLRPETLTVYRRRPAQRHRRDPGRRHSQRAPRVPGGASRRGHDPRIVSRHRPGRGPRCADHLVELHRGDPGRLRAAVAARRPGRRRRCLGDRPADRGHVHRDPRHRRRAVLRAERQAGLRYHQERHHRGGGAPGLGEGVRAGQRRPRARARASPRGGGAPSR